MDPLFTPFSDYLRNQNLGTVTDNVSDELWGTASFANWFNSVPEADIKVELYIDDKLAETLPAQNLRPDLANKVGTGRYGFSFKIPSAYKDERPHLVNVKVDGSEYVVSFLQGVFPNLECKP